jgi:transcriptional regulator with XRE-family HTH domain
MRLSRARGHQKGLVADFRTLYGRLQAARLAARVTYRYLAKRLGFAQCTVRAKFTGMRAITTDEITLIGVICKVHPRWIMTGEGDIPFRVKKSLDSMHWVELDGTQHTKRYLTELQLVMGPYIGRYDPANDRTDLTECVEPLDSWAGC